VKRWALLASVLVLTGGLADVATARLSPTVTYHRLLTRPFPTRGLPHGFKSLEVGGALDDDFGTPGDDDKVGTVRVTLNGPDGRDEIFYDIFSSPKAALYGLSHPASNLRRVARIHGFRSRAPSSRWAPHLVAT